MQRRTFLECLGAAAAAATLGRSESASSSPALAAASPSTDESAVALQGLLGAVAARPVGGGFRVSAVSAIDRGAVTVMLTRDDRSAMVRVFRRSGSSSGLASSAIFDLRLMNGADGDEGTNERVGLAVMTLASRLSRLERADLHGYARAARRALASHDEFLRMHGGTPVVATT